MPYSNLLPVIPYLLLFSASSSAINALPEKTGFSGYLNVGLAGGEAQSNLLYKVLGNKVSADSAALNGAPETTAIVLPILAGEVSYTWAQRGTQLFLSLIHI